MNKTSAISAENLAIRIKGTEIVGGINFRVPEGAYVAIVGPNGSGKTTFLKALTGVIKDISGRIELHGKAPKDFPAGKISYVPQVKSMDRSFPAMAIELVISGIIRKWPFFPGRGLRNSAMEMLEETGAAHLAKRQLNTLSGGELQRIYLARALIRNPKILLLDEPATGIDLVCEASLSRLIRRFNNEEGTTVIMVTHDWSSAYHHTNYTLLLNKRQVFFGDSKTAFSDENLQKAFSHLGHEHKVKFGLREME
jgi:zinc transport system ATP-binding protein